MLRSPAHYGFKMNHGRCRLGPTAWLISRTARRHILRRPVSGSSEAADRGDSNSSTWGAGQARPAREPIFDVLGRGAMWLARWGRLPAQLARNTGLGCPRRGDSETSPFIEGARLVAPVFWRPRRGAVGVGLRR